MFRPKVVTHVLGTFCYLCVRSVQMTGELTFRYINPPDEIVLGPGDSILVEPGTTHTWRNDAATVMTCIWVEQMKTTKFRSQKP